MRASGGCLRKARQKHIKLIQMDIQKLAEGYLKDFNSRIEQSLINVCKENGVEISKEGGKRITRVIFGNESNYSEFWLDYETDNRKLVMSTEIKFYNEFPNIKLPDLIIK